MKMNNMIRYCFYVVLITLLSGCGCTQNESKPDNEYRLHISKASLKRDILSEEMKVLHNNNDTSAFKDAVQQYWAEKLIVQHNNKELINNGNADVEVAEPFSFSLYRINGKDSDRIDFDSAIATNLARPIIDSLKVQVPIFLKELEDTLSKKPRPNIY